MRAGHRYPEEKYMSAKPWRLCPICGGDDWCGFTSFLCSCMREKEGSFKTGIQSNGDEFYLHWLEPGRVNMEVLKDDGPVVSTETAPVERRDKVYRDLLGFLHLLPGHREDLLRRGLTDWEIRKNCYRSVPEKPWSICKMLISVGHDLAGIPGFYKATGLRGGTYWTFDRKHGYFIPIRDEKGRIQALHRRMDDVRGGKYMLFSGHKNRGGCSCGTPAHVAGPTEIKDKRVWITEGPLKSDIASKYLRAVVIGAMSAVTWRPVVQAIQTHRTKEVVIAYDSDVETNLKVMRAYNLLKDELKKQGLAVSRALWKGAKGIDDALTGGLEVKVVREE